MKVKGHAKTTGAASRTTTADVSSGSTKVRGGSKSRRGDPAPTPNDTVPDQRHQTQHRRTTEPSDTLPTGGTVPIIPNPSKAQQKLLANPKLQAKMAARLPEGINPLRAAGGFKNLGQFVAAVNASNNQGIDFLALRRLMIGPEGLSLGQAMQQMKGMDTRTARAAANDATVMANLDVVEAADTVPTQKTKRNGRN